MDYFNVIYPCNAFLFCLQVVQTKPDIFPIGIFLPGFADPFTVHLAFVRVVQNPEWFQ